LTRPALFKYRCLDFREKRIPDEGRTRQADVNEDDDSVHNCVLRNAESARVKNRHRMSDALSLSCLLSRCDTRVILGRFFCPLFSCSALSFFSFTATGHARARAYMCVCVCVCVRARARNEDPKYMNSMTPQD